MNHKIFQKVLTTGAICDILTSSKEREDTRMYDLLYRNIFTNKALFKGMADDLRLYFWWEIVKYEGRGRLTAEEAEHLKRCLVLVTRV